MFSFKTTVINERIQKYELLSNQIVLSYAEVLELWKMNEEFKIFFNMTLSNSPFDAFRWETPAVTNHSVKRPFEFVLLNSPRLSRTPDKNTFSKQFHEVNSDGIAVFENLGRDAVMIVPAPLSETSGYDHLASFIRTAPDAQKNSLWSSVGGIMLKMLSDVPIWLSTAGGGVAWLHVRLDSHPKYYGYAPYREVT